MDTGLIGGAFNAIGGIIQGIAANRAKKDMQRQLNKELERQARYQQQAFGGFEGYVPSLGVETARQQLKKGVDRRLAEYAVLKDTPLDTEQAPAVTAARDSAYYDLAGNSRAKYGSYADWQLEQAIARIRQQNELNKISDFSRGTASVFPYKMYDAQHSEDGLNFLGSAISSLGGAAANWAQLAQKPPTNQQQIKPDSTMWM